MEIVINRMRQHTLEIHLTAEKVGETSITELSSRLQGKERFLSAESLSVLEKDPRAGVRSIAARIRRSLVVESLEKERLENLCRYERTLWDQGLTRIAGLDEAGVGPLAGPVIAAAVFFPPGFTIEGVNDSKKLSPARREELACLIKKNAAAWAVGQASPLEIDEINIFQASLLAMRRALAKLCPAPDHLLIDARRLEGIELPQTSIIRGDSVSFTIAAASIIAKTRRDELMRKLDDEYPDYGFRQHKGYPTRYHREALRRLGPTPAHRRSFSLKSS